MTLNYKLFLCIIIALLATGTSFSYSNESPVLNDQLKNEYRTILREPDPEIRLKRFEKYIINGSPYDRYFILGRAALAALDSNQISKADRYAKELLNLSLKFYPDWNYGNAVYYGLMVQGLVSIESGEVEEAKRYLLLSGRSASSPQLKTFGPNMRLAKKLIDLGEIETVIEFLDLCKNIWEQERGRLDQWKEDITNDTMPEFGSSIK